MSFSGTAHIERSVRLACVLEATARKPGNVHPGVSFDDLAYANFVRSAQTVAPILAEASVRGVGRTVLTAIEATDVAVGRNTNLGLVLLLTPLAAVPMGTALVDGVLAVLDRLTPEDATLVYEAIRLANPGGLGRTMDQDVRQPPTQPLRDLMQLAAGRDSIASEYVTGFQIVLGFGTSRLKTARDFPSRWEENIIRLHLSLMASYPDTLIARKCGREVASQSARLAQAVLDAGWPTDLAGVDKLIELDAWLRADGHQRNPGTTADLVGASLFSVLRDGILPIPAPWELGLGDNASLRLFRSSGI